VFDETETATIRRLLNQIDDREAKILRMRFGLDDHEPLTLKEIGQKIGLTRERVRQLERVALKKLNDLLMEERATPPSAPAPPPARRRSRRSKPPS
jgi:RNA polymerase primary sigma factor